MENTQQPIDLFLHIKRRLHNVGFEQGVDFTVFTRYGVDMVDFCGEYFVAAMLRPGLC